MPTHPGPFARARLRRALPLWLVLASLFIGLVATAASVVVASYRFEFYNPFPTPRATTQWSAVVRLPSHTDVVLGTFQRGVAFWASNTEPGAPQLAFLGEQYEEVDATGDRRPPFARAKYKGCVQYISCWRAGWPCLAAEGRSVRSFPTGPGTPTITRAWLTTRRSGGYPVDIPLRPIWTGVLANTLLYAAPTLALLATTRLGLLCRAEPPKTPARPLPRLRL